MRFPQATYFAILGFVIGSIPTIFGKISAAQAYRGGWELVIGILVGVIGVLISFVFSSETLKERLFKKKEHKEV